MSSNERIPWLKGRRVVPARTLLARGDAWLDKTRAMSWRGNSRGSLGRLPSTRGCRLGTSRPIHPRARSCAGKDEFLEPHLRALRSLVLLCIEYMRHEVDRLTQEHPEVARLLRDGGVSGISGCHTSARCAMPKPLPKRSQTGIKARPGDVRVSRLLRGPIPGKKNRSRSGSSGSTRARYRRSHRGLLGESQGPG